MRHLSVVDGTTSRIILFITGAILVIITAGMVLLAAESKPIPPELTAVMTSFIGFIIGSRVSPPDVTNAVIDEYLTKHPLPPTTGGTPTP